MNSLRHIPFAISVGKGYSLKNNSSDLVNMYVHIKQEGAKSNHILLNTEGAEYLTEVEYEIYGTYEFLGVVYIVTSDMLYSYNDTTILFIEIGAVSFDTKVVFADNGIDMMMVGVNGYAYTPTTSTLKNMNTEDGWYPADTVAYMDGYFIFNRSGTGQFFISRLYSTELDPIDWASAESAPDDTVGVAVANRQLWLFGEKSTEVWYDSGDPDFPFTRINGAVTDIGCADSKTIAQIRDGIFFVGRDFKVYLTSGYTPRVISTPAVNKILEESEPKKISAFTFYNNTHWFYALTIDDEYTFVYDIDSKQWHTRVSCDYNRWFINGTLNRHGDNNLLGFSGKKFYELSTKIFTEDGTPIRREAITLPLNDTVNRFLLTEVQLDMDVALNLNAEVTLQISRDGGRSWGNNNYAYTGKIADREKRVRWLRLGQARDCILKIVITAPIPIRILGLYART